MLTTFFGGIWCGRGKLMAICTYETVGKNMPTVWRVVKIVDQLTKSIILVSKTFAPC